MGLTGADEDLHARPVGAPDAWQENCFVLGHDADADVSVYVHVERLLGGVELKVAVATADGVRWVDAHDDWWPDVRTPYEDVRVAWAGEGLALDLSLQAHLGPVDHAAALAVLGLPGAERDHYEVAGRWRGTVTIDGGTRTCAGLFVRDHTWGVREYRRFGASWWWPTCLDGGDAYVGGVAVDLDGAQLGYGIVADADGIAIGTDVAVDVTDGAPEPGAYGAVNVSFTPVDREPVVVTSRTHRHLCTTFPGFGVDRRWNEAYSTCRWGDRTGFGTRELGT